MWLLPFLAGLLPAADIYVYTAPDGTLVVTDSPQHQGFELWWDDPEPGVFLPNGVPMPKLDRVANLDGYDHLFRATGAAVGLPPELLKAVCVAESRMNPRAVSPAGARGLMQLIPSTAAHLGVTDPFDPAQSIRGGGTYLAKQVAEFHSYELALAAYNAGPGNVRRAGGIPPIHETQVYVSRVMGLYQHFRDARPVRI
jgi:soluble lytic murein transglycosylase-like protein